MMSAPFLSVVIPAYNEAKRIGDTLEQVASYLQRQNYPSEIVVANDGSTDATAFVVLETFKRYPTINLLNLDHGGKGWAVQKGMLAARGEYRFMCDADLSMPIEQLERFLCQEADIVIGSRELPESARVGEPSQRKILSAAFRQATGILVPGIRDTQCGFKMFRGAVADDLFSRQTLRGFAFDVEILYLAWRLGYSIREIPIVWHYRAESKVRPVRDAAKMAGDLLRISYRHRGIPARIGKTTFGKGASRT